MKKLENKVSVVYSDGRIGGVIAKAFAMEGATVYLFGRTEWKLSAIEEEIKSVGGEIYTKVLDALVEDAVNEELNAVIEKEGKVDISFNAIGLSQKGIQGLPLTELSVDQFLLPANVYLKSHFITARLAARQMAKQGNGVIIMHTPNASRTSNPYVGGMPSCWAAMETLCRSLSVENSPSGVRTVCLLTTGIPETPLIDEVWDIHGKAHGLSFDDFHQVMEGATHRKKLTTLKELTSAAVFIASDDGTGITGTVFNLTAGMVV